MTTWPWPQPIDDGAARHILPGTRLPDVALAATRGAAVNLARFQERAVVFVYPFAGTPGVPNPPNWDTIAGAHGSTPEAEGFRDLHDAFQIAGYEVFGVSGQTTSAQQA
ncbi:MAG: peroxiredoxin, partial [Hyphomicrobium sp.]